MAVRTFIAVSALATAAAFAQTGEPIAYPARGQDAKQQDQDRYQCYDWARGQSGFDPTRVAEAPPMPSAPPAQQQQQKPQASSDPTGGMAKGAIGGAAIGELAHKDVGHAAAAGALGSGLLTKIKQQQQASKQASAPAPVPVAAAPNPRLQQKAAYDRAFAACLEGRGYTVR